MKSTKAATATPKPFLNMRWAQMEALKAGGIASGVSKGPPPSPAGVCAFRKIS